MKKRYTYIEKRLLPIPVGLCIAFTFIANAGEKSDWQLESESFAQELGVPLESISDRYSTCDEMQENERKIEESLTMGYAWLEIEELILTGQIQIRNDNDVEKIAKRAQQYAIYWFMNGCERGSASSHYALSEIYRYQNPLLAEEHARSAVCIWEQLFPKITSKECITYMLCLGKGWGCKRDIDKAKTVYSVYIERCTEERTEATPWKLLNIGD